MAVSNEPCTYKHKGIDYKGWLVTSDRMSGRASYIFVKVRDEGFGWPISEDIAIRYGVISDQPLAGWYIEKEDVKLTSSLSLKDIYV